MQHLVDRHYTPSSNDIWSGRQDSLEQERFFQIVDCIDLREGLLQETHYDLAIIGFQCDEGVKRNLGRIGAAEGPQSIRQQLGNMPVHESLSIVDLGNINCIDGDLESAQKALAKLIDYCQDNQIKTIALGGGHEIAYASFLGLKRLYPSLGVINFDAHFDLRHHEQSTSGTPFLQMANDKAKLSQPFNYCCLGIQKTANTQSLFNTAKELKVNYLKAETLYETSLAWQHAYLDEFFNKQSHLYLTICMDVFRTSIAPGVSSPQPLGLSPSEVLPLIRYILQSDKVVHIDIAETSPPYDVDNQTSRLASHIAAEVVYHL